MSGPRAVVVEIVERFKKPLEDSLVEGIIAPHIVRINGTEVAMPTGYPITVNDLGTEDVCTVTLTVFAKRIFVGREYMDAEVAESVRVAQQALVDAHREAAQGAARSSAAVEAATRQLEAAQQELYAAGSEMTE